MTEWISSQPTPDPVAPAGAAPLVLAAEITARLSTQLSHVRLHGYRSPGPRRPASGSGGAPGGAPDGAPDGATPTLVAVAHGSRDPRALPTVRALLDRVRALRPDLPVRLGHIELNRPRLADVLAELSGRAVLVPLLFGHGYHVTHDLPAALAAAPHLDGTVAAPLGPHSLLVEALYGRLLEAGFPDAPARARTAVVLASAGSRAARSGEDTARLARLLSARLGGVPVLPAFASAATPTVPEAVRLLTARGYDRIALASCFTAPGRFAAECAAHAPGAAAAPLGDHPALARLVLHRYDEAVARVSGHAPAPAHHRALAPAHG